VQSSSRDYKVTLKLGKLASENAQLARKSVEAAKCLLGEDNQPPESAPTTRSVMRDSVKNLLRQIKDLRGGGSFKSTSSADVGQDLSSHEEGRPSDREPISAASDLNHVDLPLSDPEFDPFPDDEESLTGNSRRCLIVVGSLFVICCLALPTVIIAHHMLASKNVNQQQMSDHYFTDCKFFNDLQNKFMRKKLNPSNYDEIEEPLALPVEKNPMVLQAPVKAGVCSGIPPARMFDCYPENGASKEKCQARGCCWAPRGAKPSVPDGQHVCHILQKKPKSIYKQSKNNTGKKIEEAPSP
jgi:Trefoil (P-type) domain